MNHAVIFTLGFLLGGLTIHVYSRQQENQEIDRLEAWAEAQAKSTWDGEDPLPTEVMNAQPPQFSVHVKTAATTAHVREAVIDELERIAQQSRKQRPSESHLQ